MPAVSGAGRFLGEPDLLTEDQPVYLGAVVVADRREWADAPGEVFTASTFGIAGPRSSRPAPAFPPLPGPERPA